MVFIGSLLIVLIQIPNVMGDEVKDIAIDESTTVERTGHGDMAPRGMEYYRLDKKDCSKDAYFDSVNTNGAYQELRGLPSQWWVAHPSDGGVPYTNTWIVSRNIEVKAVQCIFDKAIYDNYCPSGTEQGIAVRFFFVDGAFYINLLRKYIEKTGEVPKGILSPATNTQHKEFLEYITKELREETVGVVTKVLLKSDSSYYKDIGYLNDCIMNILIHGLLQNDVIAHSVACIPEGPNSY